MTLIQFLNLILINLVVLMALSYFWSFYTHKLFKPFAWLDAQKHKQLKKPIASQERNFKDKIRYYSLWLQLKRISDRNIKGAVAELGVYKGETARLIHHMLPDRKFYLFDSFSGLPKQVIKEDCDGTVRPQTVKFDNTTPDEVLKYIDGDASNLIIKEGLFPDTTEGITETNYAFVHIDADLYQSTIDALQYFYPKLSDGGTIIIHDYNHNWEGVKKAVDEFEQTIPEIFIQLPDMYGSVVMIKNKR
ncbi:class I SAM-dependent methyltransferase [Carboxylicivirga sediminis]|uniref:Class I SAM-dependent methyltransferase n=1 Tax=Carboxylicivirga sediminis TaxID=2006564 RepID=A0A941F1U0_9BACT|nr:TylF/MycF/NovP-related O-methyltransferase [Carboxylicivirga sediminis]MBR8534802.1 class I SAM-dependent methyltransferase [Carboxylicivirga sediminis]